MVELKMGWLAPGDMFGVCDAKTHLTQKQLTDRVESGPERIGNRQLGPRLTENPRLDTFKLPKKGA
jgi:hypothetical protein